MVEKKSEKSNEPKQKNRRHKLLCELLLDFAKNTTLHGLRYVTEQGLSLVEKIFWILMFILSLGLCVILMHNVWIKWQASNVFVTFSERLTFVSEVPFPAMTICPHAKIDQRLFNYNKSVFDFKKTRQLIYSHKLNGNEFNDTFINNLIKVRLICNDFKSYTPYLARFFRKKNDDHTTVEKLIEVAPKLRDIFLVGRWNVPLDNWVDPTKIFTPVLTKEGVCFTFNSLAADEILNVDRIQRNYSYLDAAIPRRGWSLDGGYISSSHNTYPRRGQVRESEPVLNIVLKELMTRDKYCNGEQPGFKVYLHHPGDLPQTSLNYYTAVPDQNNAFAISVDVVKDSESLFHCPAYTRQCYFPGEKDLRYFKVYSQSNCQLECITNFSLAHCGCVWFHMPHNDSTAICKFTVKRACLQPALEKYFNQKCKTIQCNCWPACSSIQYEAEVYRTSSKYMQRLDNKKENRTTITMYFKKPSFVSRVRECTGMFELTDFLAYCGGLLGLFLGFSFLSLVEIFYFCTMRLGCKLRKDNQADDVEKNNHIKRIKKKFKK